MLNLKTLDIGDNPLEKAEDIELVKECPSICSLDLRNTYVTPDDVFLDIFAGLPEICNIMLKGTPLYMKYSQYRRKYTARLPKLNNLDDRKITSNDRLLAEAWVLGGKEAEMVERKR